MGLHRDLMNLKGHMNHAVTLGSFSGGRVWVEDENGDAPEKVEMKTKTRTLIGTWHDIHVGRLRLTRFVFIKSNRTRVTCGLLRPTLPGQSACVWSKTPFVASNNGTCVSVI